MIPFDPAFAPMTLDVLGHVLSRADRPADMGKYLTEEISELTGAHCVLFIQCTDLSGGHRLLSINPERRRAWAESPEALDFYRSVHSIQETRIWTRGDTSEIAEYLKRQGFNLSLAVPLKIGATRVGAMLLLGLPDETHLQSIGALLDTLSTILALILRNAVFYEKQEQIIQERTESLQLTNQQLQKELIERKRAEEAAWKSEQKYRELVENANSIILRWTYEGIITFLNEFGLKFFGYEASEIIGRPMVGTIVPVTESTGRKLGPLMDEIRDAPENFDHNINENELRDGTRVWVEWANKIVPHESGQIREIFSIGTDITERKRTAEALQHAKDAAEAASRAKDQFIAVLSHELRTPLTPVLATITALEVEETLPEGIRPDLEVIRRNVELEAKLIDDLLDVTRISKGKLVLLSEPLDAHECLRSTLEICQSEIEEKHLQLSLELHATRHHIKADSTRMRQVFWNLLKNAIKFTPPGGRISLRTTNQEERLRIEITDTGIGIEPEIMPRIFNVFEQGELTKTRRFGGLGLGLSIAKAVMELHGGRLTASSEGKGRGATFTVELETLIPSPAPPCHTQPCQHLAHPKKQKILLVEDHPDTLRIIAKLLEKWGYTVTTASSVRSALEAAKTETFDLLVSDLGLPDGSGLEIIQQLKERHPIRGIALSGYGTDEDVNQTRSVGFEDHLIKPVSVDALRSAIERVMARREEKCLSQAAAEGEVGNHQRHNGNDDQRPDV